MDRIYSAFFIIAGVLISLPAGAATDAPACGPGDEQGKAMVERINQRYDDFFRRRRELEEEDERRQAASQEIKKIRAQHAEELRKAAAQYKREKPKIDPRLEQEWNESEQRWKDSLNMARRCFVEKRDAVKALELKGRKIPGKLEYDLEDD